MSDKQPLSEWLVRTLIGLVCGGLGFVAQDQYQRYWEEKGRGLARLESLRELSTLLDESYSIFANQNYQARRLAELLHQSHPKEVAELCAGRSCGYDEMFFLLFDRFTPEESELQKLIRSTTMNSQRRVNEQMSQWLEASPAFTARIEPAPDRARLAEELGVLRQHLNQWHDKYRAWIPDEPKHTLVYLADEKAHGVGFPSGIEPLVADVISSWR